MVILNIDTGKKTELVDITSRIKRVVDKQKVNSGSCVIFCPHTTAGLTINENADPSVKEDILGHLEELVPRSKKYLHLEGNSDGHIKAALAGNCLTVIIEDQNLALGTWQGIYFCEFDGPRNRKVYLKISKD